MADIIGTSGNDVLQNPSGGSGGTLVLVLSGTIAEGTWPNINILVNGSPIQSGITVNANNATGATQTITVSIPATTAISSVAIDYTNDSQTSWDSGDRNLYISSVTLNGTQLSPTSATYVRTQNGSYYDTIAGQGAMLWSGVLTWSGASLQGATGGSGTPTNDTFNGLSGLDTLVYAGLHTEYGITPTSAGATVTHGSEVDSLVSVERLQFSDEKIALDVGGNAGWAVKIISSLFGPSFVTNKAIVGIGVSLLDAGMAPTDLARVAIGTAAFQALAGGSSNTAFVNTVYYNLTGTSPSPAVLNTLVGLLDSGAQTQVSLEMVAAGLVGVPPMIEYV